MCLYCVLCKVFYALVINAPIAPPIMAEINAIIISIFLILLLSIKLRNSFV